MHTEGNGKRSYAYKWRHILPPPERSGKPLDDVDAVEVLGGLDLVRVRVRVRVGVLGLGALGLGGVRG